MKLGLLFGFICSIFSVLGQTASGNSDLPSKVRPAFIALFVNDVQTMKTWYEEKLGFKELQYKMVGDKMGFAMLEWNGIWIEMIQNPKTVTRKDFRNSFPAATDVEGFFKLGFYAENLDELETKFREKAISFKYPMMKNDNFKMRLFIIEDPEGNWIQFYRIDK